jgi:hypothetical protein
MDCDESNSKNPLFFDDELTLEYGRNRRGKTSKPSAAAATKIGSLTGGTTDQLESCRHTRSPVR